MGLSWFTKKDPDIPTGYSNTADLDLIAQELSEEGLKVTPGMIAKFIEENPNRLKALKQEDPLVKSLAARYKEVTGSPITEYKAPVPEVEVSSTVSMVLAGIEKAKNITTADLPAEELTSLVEGLHDEMFTGFPFTQAEYDVVMTSLTGDPDAMNISDELKDIDDILRDLEMEFGAPGSSPGGNEHEQLGKLANNIVTKFVNAGIKNFPEIVSKIAAQVDESKLRKILPYLKQQAGVQPVEGVKEFHPQDLEGIYAKLHQPQDMKDAEKLIGKRIRLHPPKGVEDKPSDFIIVAIEEWGKRDPGVEKFGPMFAEMEPGEKALVAVVEVLTIGGTQRKGIQVEMFKELQTQGRAEILPDFTKQKERDELIDKIADGLASVGDITRADSMRSKKGRTPASIGNENWDEGLRNVEGHITDLKKRYDVATGRKMLEPYAFEDVDTDQIMEHIDRGKKRPSTDFARQEFPELWGEALDIHNQILLVNASGGYDGDAVGHTQIENYHRNIRTGYPWAYMRALGAAQMRVTLQYKDAKPERVEYLLGLVKEEHEKAKDYPRLNAEFFTKQWMKNQIHKGDHPSNQDVIHHLSTRYEQDISNARIRELRELAYVELARDISLQQNKSLDTRYNNLVTLYKDLPPLTVKAADSKVLQEYSTPPPLAFLMGEYVNGTKVQYLLDPTAGNGMLFINTMNDATFANEISQNRIDNLKRLPLHKIEITTHDATQPWPEGEMPAQMRGSYMAIVGNPPFGSIDKVKIDDHFITKKEHQVIMNTLPLMNDNGKAAFIVGGNLELDPNGRIDGYEQHFYNWLYKNYNVEDIINLGPNYFARMGTGTRWPPRLILINGRKPVPEGVAPAFTKEQVEPMELWNDVYVQVEKLLAPPNTKIMEKPTQERPDVRERPPAEEKVDIPPTPPSDGTGLPGGDPTPQPPAPPGDGVPKPPPPGPLTAGGVEPPIGISLKDIREKAKNKLSEREAGSVVPYKSRSKAPSGGTVLPATMANEIEEALYQLEGEVGNLDDYVQDMLHYDTQEELFKSFYDHQVDGLAMAVFNMENGEAVIIGDQTGTGKGRIAAGVLRYAHHKGHKPIFMTETANLFSDIYRDLIGIGSGELRPLIVNQEYEGARVVITDPNGNEVYKANTGDINRAFKNGEIPDEVDIMLITYSQINSDRYVERRAFMNAVARGNIIVLDESHNAAGESNTGAYMQAITEASQGVIFLSATYAKRADNFPLYSIKTVIREANNTSEQLTESMAAGGPALQEIVSSELVSGMQLLRRERDMTGIEINYKVVGHDEAGNINEHGKEILKKYDGITDIMNDIVDFQRIYIKPYIKRRTAEIKNEGKKMGIRPGTVKMGVYNHPYFSKVYNVIDQLLFSLKVNDVADMAIAELQAGRKPFITFKSTMETQFGELDFEPGETLRTDFAVVLERGLKGVMKVTVTEPTGEKYPEIIEPAELGTFAQQQYYRLIDRIRVMSSGVTASPIDVLHRRIEAAGFKVLEVTGRGIKFELNEEGTEGKISHRQRMPKNIAIRHFNNEPGWAMIGNVSASTGLSIHSGHEFLDHAQRVGIDIQPDPNINTVMQKRGRINRAGQVVLPVYYNVSTLVPAEMRLLMMTKSKLKSLDANTTSNQKQSSKIVDMEDFFNKYGDQVVVEYLQDNVEFNRRIDDPLGLEKEGEQINKEDAAHRVTGKIAILPTPQQEEFYADVMDRYKTLMEYLEQTDQNDLVVAPMDLQAVTKDSYVAITGRGGYSAFGDDSTLELMEVNALKKPMMKKEIQELLNKELLGVDAEAYKDNISLQIDEGTTKAIENNIKEINEYYDNRIKELDETYKSKLDDGMDPMDAQREKQDAIAVLESARKARTDNSRDGIEGVRIRLQNLVTYFKPGQVYELPYENNPNSYTRMNKGIFLGFNINMNKKNPWIPSNFKMKFATSDSRRSFMVPASKKDYVNSVMAANVYVKEHERNEFWEQWDSFAKGGDQRIHRWVVTGNILQAFAHYKGRLIEFTTKDGMVRKGILMPENYQPNQMEQVVISIGQAYNIIRALPDGDYIESTDGDVVIRKGIPPAKYSYWVDTTDQHYTLSVPSSRKRGAKYWDRDVSKLPDMMNRQEFEVLGDRMAGYFPEPQLREILDYLDDKFKVTMATRRDNVSRGSANAAEANLNIISEHGKDEVIVNRGGLSDPAQAMDMASNDTGLNYTRISVEPLDDGKGTKKIWEIMFEGEVKLGVKIKFQSPRNRKALGSYNPSTGKISMKYENNLDTVAHEIGHDLDDFWGIASPEYEHRFSRLDQELRYFWVHGSDPPKGMPYEQAQKYRRQEGVAEWIRAWMGNPTETESKTPIFTEWFETRIPEDFRRSIREFGDEIRRYHAATPLDKIGAQVQHADVAPKTLGSAFMSQFRKVNSGGLEWTFIDKLIYNWFTSNHPWEKAYFEAASMKGIKKKQIRGYGKEAIDPTQNALMLGHLLAGHHDIVGRQLENGIIDPDFNVYIDEQEREPFTAKFILGALDKSDLGTIAKDFTSAVNYMVAKRTISYAHTMQFNIVQADLQAMGNLMVQGQLKLPPLDIIRKHPYLQEKHSDAISKALEWAADNGLSPEDIWHPAERYDTRGKILTGIAEGTESDWVAAQKAIAQVEKDPDALKRYEETLRRYEGMANCMLLNMVKADLMSQETYDYIKARHLSYVALRRIMGTGPEEIMATDELLEKAGVGKKGLAEMEFPEYTKAIKGSSKGIQDPFLTLLDYVSKTTYLTSQNKFLNAFFNMLTPGYGKDYFMEPKDENIGFPRGMHEEDPQMLVKIATRVTRKVSPYTIEMYKNGKQVFWDVDPLYYNALMGTIDTVHPNIVTHLADLIRWTVVHSPVFASKNFARDMQSRLVISPVGTHKGSFKNLAEAKELFQYAGGGQFGFYIKNNKDYLRFMKQAMMELSGDKATLLVNADMWTEEIWDKYYKRILSMSETTPRLIEFRNQYNYAEKHYPGWSTPAKIIFAAYHGRNLLDFAVGGVLGKMVSRIMAFFDPRVQGSRRYAQGWRDYPERMWPHTVWFSIIPAFLASLMISRTDDDTQLEYRKLPNWRRDLFWNIPLPAGSPIRWIAIPKGFEVGVVGSMFQRAFDYFLIGDKDAFKNSTLQNALTAMMPFDENSFLSTLSGLIIAIGKKDQFRQKYVVNPRDLQKDIRERNNEQASEFGKHLMEASGWVNSKVGPEKINKPFIDPKVADALIKSYTTYFGGAFLKTYESVFGDKKKDSYYNWDWSTTGWFRRQEIYGSIDVQWVIKRMHEMELFWSDEYQDLNGTIQQYFAAPTPQAKRKVGVVVLKKAEYVRKQWEGKDFVQERIDEANRPPQPKGIGPRKKL